MYVNVNVNMCVCVCTIPGVQKKQRGGELFIVWVSIVFVYEKNDCVDGLG